jgi:hypothetical protein
MAFVAVLVIVPSVAIVAAAALLYLRAERLASSVAPPTATAPVASVAASATPSPSATTADVDAAPPVHSAPSATPSGRSPPVPPMPTRPVHIVVGGATGGHWGGPAPVAQAIESHGRELLACFPKFDPPPGKRASRDYHVVLDANAKALEVQSLGPNDAVDRCVVPILRRLTYPPYATPIDGQTFGITPRINWMVD